MHDAGIVNTYGGANGTGLIRPIHVSPSRSRAAAEWQQSGFFALWPYIALYVYSAWQSYLCPLPHAFLRCRQSAQ